MDLATIKIQILVLGLLILAASAGGFLAKKLKINEIVGYLIGGMLVGPHLPRFLFQLFNVNPHLPDLSSTRITRYLSIYQESFQNYTFFIFIFLGVISFSLGEELHHKRVKNAGSKIILLSLFQGFFTMGTITLLFHFVLKAPLLLSMAFGVIGIATAPSLNFSLMSKFKIEGKLKHLFSNVVIFGDVLEIILFSIVLGVFHLQKIDMEISFQSIGFVFFKELSLSLMAGLCLFIFLKLTLRKKRQTLNHPQTEHHSLLTTILSEHQTPSVEIFLFLVSSLALVLAFSLHFESPFLIATLFAGILISNFHSKSLFDTLKIQNIMPIFNLLFFAIVGANVELGSFNKTTLLFGLVFIVGRASAKIISVRLGAAIGGYDPKIAACLPYLMLPQAGLAVIETILLAALLPEKESALVYNTVLPAIVVFEIAGAWVSSRTLKKWKNYVVGEKEFFQSTTLQVETESAEAVNGAESGVSHRGGPILVGDETWRTILDDRLFYIPSRKEKPFTKQDVLTILSTKLVKLDIADEIETILNPVAEREALSSTGMGQGIAFPHARLACVKKVVVLFAFLESPIEWGAIDGKPVDQVFLILTPEEEPEKHLIAIKTIVTHISKPGFKESLKQQLTTI